MIFLYTYLAIGAIAFVLIYVSHRRAHDQERQELRKLFESAGGKRRTTAEMVLEDIVVPIVAGALVVVAWPFVVVMQCRDKLSPKQEVGPWQDKEFAVLPEHLAEQLTVDEIERREMVTDPLGAVPDVPFGHLNTAWNRFVAKSEPKSALWSFMATWESSWSGCELRQGYVWVSDAGVGQYFHTVWKSIPSKETQNMSTN